MTKHIYTGDGKFYQGLPASDIDSDDLTPEQLVLLQSGVANGLYEVEGATTRPEPVPQPVVEPTAQEPEVQPAQEIVENVQPDAETEPPTQETGI